MSYIDYEKGSYVTLVCHTAAVRMMLCRHGNITSGHCFFFPPPHTSTYSPALYEKKPLCGHRPSGVSLRCVSLFSSISFWISLQVPTSLTAALASLWSHEKKIVYVKHFWICILCFYNCSGCLIWILWLIMLPHPDTEDLQCDQTILQLCSGLYRSCVSPSRGGSSCFSLFWPMQPCLCSWR